MRIRLLTRNKFALVSVDISHSDVDRLFHYSIPFLLIDEIIPGKRVRVPFGRGSALKFGYVIEISNKLPDDIKEEQIKTLHSVCDDFPVLTSEMIKLVKWMKQKYYTTLISAINCVTPSFKSNGLFPTSKAKRKKLAKQTNVIELNNEQKNALNEINKNLENKPILLFGVTGSGKTEVYLHAIENILNSGKQAIVLVPEIALTPQMVYHFSARFGEKVAVTHSRMTPGERFVVWKSILDGETHLLIGPRSAIFAPFNRLGLIVIDEEHEHTYQSETSPKYDAREIAIKRAELSGATVILGSATPSLESFTNAIEERYKLVKLTQRINKSVPEINIIDMRQEMAKGNVSMFSRDFENALKNTLASGKQAILFLNRRGYSSFISCRWCGDVLSCDNCRVNYTYHTLGSRLMCHYCGKSLPLPKNCPSCSSEHLKKYGTGTQKIEEEVNRLFPDTKVLRMDMDTTKGKFGHAKILDAFKNGEAQVLIGTQMVAKGLDFPHVTMVGVVAADTSLYTGDFRSGEYTFQLLNQVAGRAGRAMDAGKVYIQTYSPEHYAITFAKQNNYEAFYKHEISLRRAMVYPPFSNVFSVLVTGPSEKEVIETLRKLTAIMEYVSIKDGKNRFEIIGLSPAFVSMIKKQYRWKLLVKSTDEASLVAFVLYSIKKLRENDPLKNINLNLTLNPRMME